MISEIAIPVKGQGLHAITNAVRPVVADDMPAHIKSALTATTLSIPFQQGQLMLGSWQGIYLWEHRHHSCTRQIVVHIQ
mgnify:CR=1 FL=1